MEKHDDLWMLRRAIEMETEAVRLYEMWADSAKNGDIAEVFKSVAEEEKVHIGEFLAMLFRMDSTLAIKLKEGFKEVSKNLLKEDIQDTSEDEKTLLE